MQPITQPSTTQQTKSQNQTNKNEPCKHDIDEGNVGGWYKTYDEALQAIAVWKQKNYPNGVSGNWLIEKCNKCGLWTPKYNVDK